MAAARAVAASRFAIEILAIASSVLLAHLLTPAEIGRAVIALIAIPLSTLVLSGAIAPLLIQRPELHRSHLEAASALGVAGGALFTVVCLAAAPLFGWLMDAETGRLLALAAPGFLIAGVAIVPDALLRRDLDFRSLAVIEVTATVGATALTIGLALAGVGGACLVWGSLAGNAIGSIGVTIVDGYRRPRLHRAEARELMSFGGPAGLSSLGALFYRRIDYVIVGARLGAAQVGAYWRAYQLGAEYQTKLTTVMLRVAFPLYSRLRDVDELRRVRSRIVRLHAALVVPPLALLIAIAPVFIPFVYGDAWKPAVTPTRLLAVIGMLNALVTGVGPLLMAVGRTRLLNRFTWLTGFGYAILIFLVAPSGIVAVSAAAMGYVIIGFFLSQEFLVRRPIGIPWSELLREVSPSFLVSGVIVGGGVPMVAALDGAGVPAPVTLVMAGLAALLVYVTLMPRVAPGAWSDLRAVVSRARTSAAEPAPTTQPTATVPRRPAELGG